ncbi:transmembrane protein 45B-like [Saccostrea echinata]|uniref:transmembrane protein 45B-like n=1 Tax=Saccostrea echinata TaxID=191078 RepID=UPI002A80AF00|nr:transmembrane protein 45B-like [Saccostrea echinata]XP_061169524.1 transmembrane protein 45B-like [Saccostrea echinata]
MGSFAGHALPGSFFIIMSLWWIICIFNRYFKSLKRNTRFKSSVIFPFLCCPGRLKEWPLEAMLKLLMVSVGFSLEIYTGTSDGKFTALGNGQHATMFFFFGITAVIDLLLFYEVPLPKDLDYVSNIIAIGIEGLLFKFHLHGRSHLDVLLHTLLIYTIALNTVGIILEMKYRNNVLCALSRCYGFLLQGTWFWQVGFILYNPNPNHIPWKPDDHDDLMIATMFYAWHVAADFLLILCIGGVIAFIHRRCGGYGEKDEFAMKRLIHTGSNGQTLISMHEDSDSDIEIRKPVSK